MLRRATAIALGLTSILLSGCGQAGPPAPPPAAPPAPTATTPEQVIRNFVTPLYAEGIPYDKARALGAQAEPVLIQLLDRQDMSASRGNIVVTLGILGSANAAQHIITFLEAGSGALAPDEARARTDAVIALGYAANGAAGATALNYLLSGADPAYWTPPRIRWTLPGGASPASRLRMRAISALGLSGRPDAHQLLLQLQKTGGGGGRGSKPSSEQSLIAEAIEANEYIAKNGLSQYYATRRF